MQNKVTISLLLFLFIWIGSFLEDRQFGREHGDDDATNSTGDNERINNGLEEGKTQSFFQTEKLRESQKNEQAGSLPT